MRKLWILLLLCFSPLVFSYQNATFTWTPPVQNEDGSPLVSADIESYNIYCNGSLLGSVVNSAGTDTWSSPDGSMPAGTYDCYATTVANGGLESAQSNSVNFTVDLSIPGAPGGLVVTFP